MSKVSWSWQMNTQHLLLGLPCFYFSVFILFIPDERCPYYPCYLPAPLTCVQHSHSCWTGLVSVAIASGSEWNVYLKRARHLRVSGSTNGTAEKHCKDTLLPALIWFSPFLSFFPSFFLSSFLSSFLSLFLQLRPLGSFLFFKPSQHKRHSWELEEETLCFVKWSKDGVLMHNNFLSWDVGNQLGV